MKQSDSATSLSKLVVSDTGCFICKEGEGDEEAATKGELRDSKEFGNSCSCRFAFHTECMEDWMKVHPNECPLCSVRLLHYKVEEVIGGVVDTSGQGLSGRTVAARRIFPSWLKWFLGFLVLLSILSCIVLVIISYAS